MADRRLPKAPQTSPKTQTRPTSIEECAHNSTGTPSPSASRRLTISIEAAIADSAFSRGVAERGPAVLFFLTEDTNRGPRNRNEPFWVNFLFALLAGSEGAFA